MYFIFYFHKYLYETYFIKLRIRNIIKLINFTQKYEKLMHKIR